MSFSISFPVGPSSQYPTSKELDCPDPFLKKRRKKKCRINQSVTVIGGADDHKIKTCSVGHMGRSALGSSK